MQVSPVRPPAVAGRFYPDRLEILSSDLNTYLGPRPAAEEKTEGALACVVPHAGYMYSGHVAGAVYRRLPARSSYIILGPNHFGRGASLAVAACESWLTPLGKVPIDRSLAQLVVRSCPLLAEDDNAHAVEHSLEVQIPFLQHRVKEFTLVPIAVGVGGYATLESLGHALAEAASKAGKPVLIIASTDLNHYEPDGITRVKDRKAIDQILALNPRGLHDVVHREGISMCGYGPTVAMLVGARELGARRAELVKYATSADAGGERDAVVGYAGIIVS